MLEYYDGRLYRLDESDASYQQWHELRKQICFSHALVKAALRYKEERVFMVKENYLQYVFEDFEAHFLANACWLVSEEGGKLRKDSFFIQLLKNEDLIGLTAVFKPFLDESGLHDCIKQKHYLYNNGRLGLLASAAQGARDNIRRAVENFANNHLPEGMLGAGEAVELQAR